MENWNSFYKQFYLLQFSRVKKVTIISCSKLICVLWIFLFQSCIQGLNMRTAPEPL